MDKEANLGRKICRVTQFIGQGRAGPELGLDGTSPLQASTCLQKTKDHILRQVRGHTRLLAWDWIWCDHQQMLSNVRFLPMGKWIPLPASFCLVPHRLSTGRLLWWDSCLVHSTGLGLREISIFWNDPGKRETWRVTPENDQEKYLWGYNLGLEKGQSAALLITRFFYLKSSKMVINK